MCILSDRKRFAKHLGWSKDMTSACTVQLITTAQVMRSKSTDADINTKQWKLWLKSLCGDRDSEQ